MSFITGAHLRPTVGTSVAPGITTPKWLPSAPSPGSVTLRTSYKGFSYNLKGLQADSVGSRRERRRKRKTERKGRKNSRNGRKRSKGGRLGGKEK